MIPILMFATVAGTCHLISHDRILGADLAAASPLFQAIAPDAVIGYAPQPGARRFFEPAELLRVARDHRLSEEPTASLCFERETAPLEPAAVLDAVRTSLAMPEATVEIVELSKFPAPKGELHFPREGLSQPASGNVAVWNGFVAYDGGRFPIWANVRIAVPVRRVVAASDLRMGKPVPAEDVRVEDATDFPRRVAALTEVSKAVGKIPRHPIRAGAPLLANDLDEPNDVDRGQTVLVEVHSGAAVLKLEATAESSGRRGDMVLLRNTSSGRSFRGRVEDRGRVLVDCPAPTGETSQQ